MKLQVKEQKYCRHCQLLEKDCNCPRTTMGAIIQCANCHMLLAQCKCNVPQATKEYRQELQEQQTLAKSNTTTQDTLFTDDFINSFTEQLQVVNPSDITPENEWQFCTFCRVKIYSQRNGFKQFCRCDLSLATIQTKRKNRQKAIDKPIALIGLKPTKLKSRAKVTSNLQEEFQINEAFAVPHEMYCKITGTYLGKFEALPVAMMQSLETPKEHSLKDDEIMNIYMDSFKLPIFLDVTPCKLKEIQLRFPHEYIMYVMYELSKTFRKLNSLDKVLVKDCLKCYPDEDIAQIAELLRLTAALFGKRLQRLEIIDLLFVDLKIGSEQIIIYLRSIFEGEIKQRQKEMHTKDKNRRRKVTLSDLQSIVYDLGLLQYKQARIGSDEDDALLQDITAVFYGTIKTAYRHTLPEDVKAFEPKYSGKIYTYSNVNDNTGKPIEPRSNGFKLNLGDI